VRTYYDQDDYEGYEAGQDLLVRRFTSWADAQGGEVDPHAVVSALQFRHTSVDGRLAHWTAALVRDFLLSYVPRELPATADEAVLVPETLRMFLRYLHETGLADPMGKPLADLEDAVAKAADEFPAAMADERKFGLSKYWVMTAARNGIDRSDLDAMNAFFSEVREGRHSYDAELVDELVARQYLERPERAFPQLPVSLPAESELADAAERSSLVAKLRKFAEWVGDGRVLTGTGTLKLADARELVSLLDTGDALEWDLGGEVQHVRSSADLPHLAILFELAKRARIVRVVKGKLVRVAKAAPLLGTPSLCGRRRSMRSPGGACWSSRAAGHPATPSCSTRTSTSCCRTCSTRSTACRSRFPWSGSPKACGWLVSKAATSIWDRRSSRSGGTGSRACSAGCSPRWPDSVRLS
jgi:hypothetical protein